MIRILFIQKRQVLEENNQLEARVSAVEEDLEDMDTDEEEELRVRQLSPLNVFRILL